MTRAEEKIRPVLGNDINQCMMCRHLQQMGEPFHRGSVGWRCAAFPGREIPEEIVMGFKDHRERWTGVVDGAPDNGLQFEQSPDWEFTYEELAGPITDDEDE